MRRAVSVTAIGSFLTGKNAARCTLEAEGIVGTKGTILFTGASAGVKGFPQSAPFAMGKFAQRRLARELHPKGIHVAWINIDGGILNPGRTEPDDKTGSMLRPEAIARTYRHLIEQDRSAWSNEIAVSPGDLAERLKEMGMKHSRGAPHHPQTQGKIERWHQTWKHRILLKNYFLPEDLEAQITNFVDHYNNQRYHESINNVTPADVYFWRDKAILKQRQSRDIAAQYPVRQ